MLKKEHKQKEYEKKRKIKNAHDNYYLFNNCISDITVIKTFNRMQK